MLYFGVCMAQTDFSVFFESGYSLNTVGEIKKNQDKFWKSLVNYTGIDAKITESFPATPYIEGGINIPFEKYKNTILYTGLIYSYTSTGGRVYYRDYSGELCRDDVLTANKLGTIIGLTSINQDGFLLDYSIALYLTFTNYKNKSTLVFGDDYNENLQNCSAVSFGIEPSIVPSYKWDRYKIGLSFSYFCSITNDVFSNDIFGNVILNNKWNSLKIGLVGSYYF